MDCKSSSALRLGYSQTIFRSNQLAISKLKNDNMPLFTAGVDQFSVFVLFDRKSADFQTSKLVEQVHGFTSPKGVDLFCL